MKKVLLTAMTLASIATSSVFGYYGANNDWIDFLTDGNQLRARTRQMGFVLGNGTIKGVFGVRDESETALGQIFTPSTVTPEGEKTKNFLNFMPTVSAGIGYTTESFGIGIGYNYRYFHGLRVRKFEIGMPGEPQNIQVTKKGTGLSVHTPVLAMNFLGNNLRIVVPIQVGVQKFDSVGLKDGNIQYTGVSLDPQIRYYTGIPAFNEVRLTIKYGMNQMSGKLGNMGEDKTYTASSFGFEFRTYFGAQVGDVGLKPFLKITYDTSLDATKTGIGDYGIKAGSGYVPLTDKSKNYDSNPWELNVLPTLGLSANSDIVNLYLEAGLGYRAVNKGIKDDPDAGASEYTGIQHSLAWSSYAEVYIRPVQDLEWYIEAEIGNAGSYGENSDGSPVFVNKDALKFNAATGITWYLPSLQ